MRILMASDGSECARRAARYGCQIAVAAEAEVTLLGVVERPPSEARRKASLESLQQELADDLRCQAVLKLRHGNAAEQVVAETHETPYHLVVIGSRGRRGWRELLMGSTTERLVHTLTVPLLIFTGPERGIRRILICTSGLKPAENDAVVGGTLARLAGAEATVLHVMSQVPLVPAAKIDDLERDAAELMESGTREGRHLRRMLDILLARGAKQPRAKIRRGLVLDEILAEAEDGDYDLIVIGAHYVPKDQSWRELRQLLQENLTADIVRRTRRPVLVVHWLEKLAWDDL